MRQTFHHANFEALAGVWNEFYSEPFHIDAQILEQNTVKSPVFDWGVSQIEVDVAGQVLGFVAFKRSAAGLYKGPNIDQAHLSAIAYRDPRVAVDLVADAKRTLRNRGVNRIHFGGDSRHFWPGCPIECGGICGFLMVEGFEDQADCFDLERDLRDYSLPRPLTAGFEYRPLVSDDDVVALRNFLESEFPGRWRHDVLEKIRIEGDPGCVFAAFEGSNVAGFALIQDSSCKLPIAGAVWRTALGENWGALGPIGVSSEKRGVGLGHSLLGAALMELKNREVHRCIIDWTNLEGFYEAHGFEIKRRYRASSLRLSD